ncbi:AraC family transcriptional regulator [Agarivorans albus]|uniref:Transcriptional regulator n=1 Tax=Agarivorans albus MKT 106 TaxID=1331007 RepID=R9PJ38_AGAAL|nr:AraC family transcriptional regulator [Agarivorans albus]GAD01345.1 transcriptional regulator [Agarivorans albus MKT 106]
MFRQEIKQLIESRISDEGMVETGVKGVHLFKVTTAIPCAPAVYEPTVVVIVSGKKEAIIEGHHYVYDSSQYLCCTMSMPVEAGTPEASPEEPLLGVYISLDTKVMTELAIEMESSATVIKHPKNSAQGLSLANWDDNFSDALLRLLQLGDNPRDSAILGASRLREFYYAVLKGEAGISARRAFGVGNEIARSIEYLSKRLSENVTIDQLASQVSMSRAVFHRKFKQATMMSPIQFMKSMRLNQAAMKIAAGNNVSEAAMAVGYVSSSQFSREFKRMYGQSPKQWSQSKGLLENIT